MRLKTESAVEKMEFDARCILIELAADMIEIDEAVEELKDLIKNTESETFSEWLES